MTLQQVLDLLNKGFPIIRHNETMEYTICKEPVDDDLLDDLFENYHLGMYKSLKDEARFCINPKLFYSHIYDRCRNNDCYVDDKAIVSECKTRSRKLFDAICHDEPKEYIDKQKHILINLVKLLERE